MPDEPNGKIDKLLKAYAEKRRGEAGAPLEMHVATRRLLQGEVARLKPKPDQAPVSLFRSWFSSSRIVVWGFSMLAIMALAAWLLTPAFAPAPKGRMKQSPSAVASGDDQMELALVREQEKRADADEHSRANSLAEAVPALPTSDGLSRLPATRENENRPTASLTEPLPTDGPRLGLSPPPLSGPGPLPIQSMTKTGPEQSRFYLQQQTDAQGQSTVKEEKQAVVVGTYAAVQSSPAAASREQDRYSPARQLFKQVEAAKPQVRQAAAERTPAILEAFELQQEGNRIRILDADGSVYEGQVTLAQPSGKKDPAGVTAGAEFRREVKRAETVKGAASSAGRSTSDMKSQTVSWRASGTNRLLNQLVVIDCTLRPAAEGPIDSSSQAAFVAQGVAGAPQTVAPPAAIVGQSARPSAGTEQGLRMQQQSQALSLTLCQGVARIGATNQIQINAVRVAP